MAKHPPLSDDGVYLVLAVMFICALVAACAAFLLAWGLFQFLLGLVLSAL
jgi:hypothetical protein